MARRVVETVKMDREHGKLLVIQIFEEGINKESVKKENRLSKKHSVLYKSLGGWEWK
jgi:hypothetical protein